MYVRERELQGMAVLGEAGMAFMHWGEASRGGVLLLRLCYEDMRMASMDSMLWRVGAAFDS